MKDGWRRKEGDDERGKDANRYVKHCNGLTLTLVSAPLIFVIFFFPYFFYLRISGYSLSRNSS